MSTHGLKPARFAVVGADHLHVFQIADGLIGEGAVAVAHAPNGAFVEGYARWRPESQERTADDILGDDSIDVVVVAGIPCERADVSLAALSAGRQVLSAKPGATTLAQLDHIRAAIARRPGRPWTVLFSERFENRAIGAAVAMARDGAVGTVAHILGAGPHRLEPARRPEWFWDAQATGGILVDIGSHQADQFLAIAVGDEVAARRDRLSSPGLSATVRCAAIGNVACPDRPNMQDIGSMTLVANGVVGDHRVDFLSADGLGSWGDVRLSIVGTDGVIEARANVDVAGRAGGEHLFVVDAAGARHVDVSDHRVDWPARFLADLADGGQRLMSQDHVVSVCQLALDAQAAASPWGSP